jgi:hypothetical protein
MLSWFLFDDCGEVLNAVFGLPSVFLEESLSFREGFKYLYFISCPFRDTVH